ncbi:DNA primase [Candidatus Methanomethylophilus alvi Mx1201]|uniref:DNA primase DnaG n=2 Tax=Methanomethylophilus alvi TaxID=1291540 RepID=M9SJP0_METAX|nr:DNA primase DnaG [Methanomethylophilus alvi]AGI85722.1 DNA primase [Candidatus Methanomethylophilus alvi Mx1201]AYQ55128.1 DNA primase [Methanomethylophilus alvi]
MNSIDPNATKYMVKAKINADGIVDKPDVVGAIFGQTEGLLGDDLDLRDLQKSGRIGRIEVDVVSKGGKSEGIIYMSSSLDQVETVILAAALETIDRVGPCKASIKVLGIEDVRITKREKIVERAKELLSSLVEQSKGTSADLAQNIRQSVQVEEITTYGKERCPAGPNVKNSEAIIIVEGRSDVLNLLRAGIKNAIAVEGTNVPKTVQDLSRERVTTAFVDGDRGGELILRELFQTAEIDYVARAPRAHEVEELSAKQLVKCLRNKVPGDQYMEMNGLSFEEKDLSAESKKELEEQEDETPAEEEYRPRNHRNGYEDRDEDRGTRRREGNSRRSRKTSDEEDEEGRYGKRRGRKGDRFDNESADRYRKKPRESSFEEEEPVEDQIVDTIPAKRRLMEETPDEEPVTEEPAVEETPVVEETPAVEEPVAEEPTVEEPAMEEAPVVEEPAVEEPVAEEPVKEEAPAEAAAEEEEKPKRTIRAPRTLRGKRDIKSDKILTPEQESLRDTLSDITGTKNSVLMSEDGTVIDKVEVKNLANYLKESDNEDIRTIVFDGVISQNILDISSGKGIKTLVCKRKGKISKLPADIVVWTRDDLV